jgi:AcrR family transcriptional regulator
MRVVSGVVRPYRGVSAAERRERRREALLDAGLDVIASDGMGGFTMTAVCARAGLTERYFYESYRSRDHLLGALFERCLHEMNTAMFAALARAPADLLERCRAAAGAMIGSLTADPRNARLYVEAIGHPVLAGRRRAAVAESAAVLAGQMRELRTLEGERFDAPLRLATLVLMGGLSETIQHWLDGSLEMTMETLVEECARLAVAVADAVQATAA